MTKPDAPTAPPPETTIDRLVGRGETAVLALRRYFAGYFWFILKNVIGWLLILLSAPAGALLPGPGGIPMFLIGFTLVALPGKRKLTTRVMRGRPLRLEAGVFTFITTFASLVAVAALLWVVGDRYQYFIQRFKIDPNQRVGFIAAVAGICVIAAIVTWGVTWLALRFVNVLIRIVPRLRRWIRPIMRRHGLVLLPPPKHNAGDPTLAVTRNNTEILELSEAQKIKFTRWWHVSRPWVRRATGFAIITAIFTFILRPVFENWHLIEPFVNGIRPMRFLVAVLMYAAFLVIFRVTAWWALLRELGVTLGAWSAMRVWSLGELTRYLPGLVSPTTARAWMLRPYDVSAIVNQTTHTVEGVLIFLASLLLAGAVMLWVAFRGIAGTTAWWAGTLAPLTLFVIAAVAHPRVFYRLLNSASELAGNGLMDGRITARTRVATMTWTIAGMFWLGWAIYLLASGPLRLSSGTAWLLGGAYAFAWCCGQAVAWAPAGMGVREIAFMAALLVVLPPHARASFDPQGLTAFAAFLAILLRVWTMAGEIIVAMASMTFDLRGALDAMRDNRPVTRFAKPAEPTSDRPA